MSGNVTTAHTASLMNGIYSGGTAEYANGIGSTTLSVSCNDAGGFSIYTIGYTGDSEGDNNLRGTNTGLTIPTGVYSQGDTTSKWSMKITKGADSGDTTNHPLTIDNGFNNFHTVPSDSDGYQRIAHKDAATDMNATPGASVTTTYDAYIDTTQAADTYTGQVKYVMVHPYDSTDKNKPTIATYMQDVDTVKAKLANATVGTELEVVDKRDNKTYTVAKMADGNIWMNQNLDLCIGCNGTATLTSENTDLNTSGTAPYADGYSNSRGVITWTPASTATTANHTINNSSVSNWSDSYTEPYSVEGGDVYVYPSIEDEEDYDTVYTSLADCTAAGYTASECNHYHRGNYYNWTAAIASNDSTNISAQYNVAANSICPKGWRLPKGQVSETVSADTAEFANLLYVSGVTSELSTEWNYATDGFNKIQTTPLYLVRSGLISSSILDYSALYGHYWSSAVYDSSSAYSLNFNSYNVNPRANLGREYGRSVRCLAPAS